MSERTGLFILALSTTLAAFTLAWFDKESNLIDTLAVGTVSGYITYLTGKTDGF